MAYMQKPFTMEDRERVCELMCNLIRGWVLDKRNTSFEYNLTHGMNKRDLLGIDPRTSPNDTATFTLTVNDSAVDVNIDGRVREVE
jgi:hypothetical protein